MPVDRTNEMRDFQAIMAMNLHSGRTCLVLRMQPQQCFPFVDNHVPKKNIENVMNCHDNSISMDQHMAMNLLCWGKK